jgi:hypothetical protein
MFGAGNLKKSLSIGKDYTIDPKSLKAAGIYFQEMCPNHPFQIDILDI